MKKTLSIVLCVLLVLLAVACSPETKQHEHKYEKVAEKSYAATCVNTGLDVYSCTECGDTYSVTLQLTDHSHAEDAKPSYSWGNAKKPNCVQTGLGWYSCQYCGTSFLEVVSKNPDAHVYYDETKKEYKDLDTSTFDEEHMTWSETAEIEMSYFTPAQKVAYCNECGEKTNLTKVVEVSNKKYAYKNITGTWILTDSETGNAYFVDVVEDKNQAITSLNLVTVDGEAESLSEKTTLTTPTRSFSDNEGVRTLKIGSDSSLTEEKGKYKLTWNGAVLDLSKERYSLSLESGHNHCYSESAGADNYASSIYKDKNFTLMSFNGESLADRTKHYVQCLTCGIKYLGINHLGADLKAVTTTNACSCGYWKNENSENGRTYSEVVVRGAQDPSTISTLKTYAGNVITLAKKLSAYAGVDNINEITAFSTESKWGDVSDGLTSLKSDIDDVTEYIKTLGLSCSDFEKVFGGDGEGGKAAENIMDCITAAKAKRDAELDDSYGTVLGEEGDDVNRLKTLLKSAVDALFSGSDFASTPIGNKTYAESGNGSVAYALKEKINADSEEVDRFICSTGTILDLEFDKYTTSYGKTLNFADNTGWELTSEGIILTKSGIQVNANGTLVFAVKAD